MMPVIRARPPSVVPEDAPTWQQALLNPEWSDPDTKSVLDTPTQRAAKNLVGLLGLNDPNAIILGMAGSPVGEGSEGGVLQKLIKAYHGSPRDFEKFDLSKIGTGEGAQSYGHGLYFAEHPEVAQAYREQLAPMSAVDQRMQGLLQKHGGDMDAALDEFMAGVYDSPEAKGRMRDALRETWTTRPPSGRTYEVQIKADPASFLDWDKPLNEQSEAVQRFARKNLMQGDFGRYSNNRIQTGADLYREAQRGREVLWKQHLVDPPVGPEGASLTLKEAGIPGIKYLDQGSRAAGEGTRNYVVFDDSLVDILKKYGVAVPFIEGMRYKAKQNGGIVPAADVHEAIGDQLTGPQRKR